MKVMLKNHGKMNEERMNPKRLQEIEEIHGNENKMTKEMKGEWGTNGTKIKEIEKQGVNHKKEARRIHMRHLKTSWIKQIKQKGFNNVKILFYSKVIVPEDRLMRETD